MGIVSDAIKIAYPDAVRQHGANEGPFTRPAFTRDGVSYSSGWYWKNSDGDRFYFSTFEGAALDLANDIGMNDDEARCVIAAGKAVA